MYEKGIEKLRVEKEQVERQLAQEQHKKQRLENRAAQYERNERMQRVHDLIVRSADVQSIAPMTKLLTRTEYYPFAKKVFTLSDVKGLLMETVNEHNKNEFGGD